MKNEIPVLPEHIHAQFGFTISSLSESIHLSAKVSYEFVNIPEQQDCHLYLIHLPVLEYTAGIQLDNIKYLVISMISGAERLNISTTRNKSSSGMTKILRMFS